MSSFYKTSSQVTLNLLTKMERISHAHIVRKLPSTATRVLWSFIRAVFILGFCFIILYPVITMVSKAFMHTVDIYDNTVLWVPKNFTLNNLKMAWEAMNYPQAFLNSLLLTATTTTLQVFSCMMVGYGFARFKFRFKNILFAILVFTIVIPPQQIIVPIFLYFRNFNLYGILPLLGMKPVNLLDSFWPFLALSATSMGIRNGLFVFIFRQGFRAMPLETEEAARVDGAGAFRTFLSIMVPGSVALIATIVLFSFVWQWNDTFYSGIFLNKTRLLPQAYQLFNSYIGGRDLLTGISKFASEYDLKDRRVLSLLRQSGIFMIMSPLIVLYLFTQKHFVESIERSGIVG